MYINHYTNIFKKNEKLFNALVTKVEHESGAHINVGSTVDPHQYVIQIHAQ